MGIRPPRSIRTQVRHRQVSGVVDTHDCSGLTGVVGEHRVSPDSAMVRRQPVGGVVSHEETSEGGQLAPISPTARLACGAVPAGSASVPVGELCSVSPPGETGIASCLERVEHQSASAALGAGACGSSACACVLTCAFGCASACVRRRECTHDPPPLCSPPGGGEGAAPSSYRLLYLRGLEGGGGN